MSAGDSTFESLVSGLRAAGEPSRLRLLAVCAQGEWTVTELVQVLGQSQPRISRHLKILADAGLLERLREGNWVFYRQAPDGQGADLARRLIELVPETDPYFILDRRRLQTVREARRQQAEQWFNGRASGWDSERDLGVDGAMVEAALADLFSQAPIDTALDIGTGTGRMLQIMGPHIKMGLGLDLSRDMLAIARARLDAQDLRHCQVRHGDMYALPFEDGCFSVAVLHQVLHFADDPLTVLLEARRVLRPGGRMIIVDLARHEQEWLRTQRRHRRLGFAQHEMHTWFERLGLFEEAPYQLDGPELTVVIWVARDQRPVVDQSHQGQRSNAA